MATSNSVTIQRGVGALAVVLLTLTGAGLYHGSTKVATWWNQTPVVTVTSSVTSIKPWTWIDYSTNGYTTWTSDSDLEIIDKSHKGKILVGSTKSGTYRLQGSAHFHGDSGEASVCMVTIGNGPIPVPPVPVDDFSLSLSKAYAAETDTDKAVSVKILAAIYAQGSTIAADKTNVTWNDMFSKLSTVFGSAKLNQKLLYIQKAIQAEALKEMPSSAVPANNISDSDRTKAAAFFFTAADLVSKLK